MLIVNTLAKTLISKHVRNRHRGRRNICQARYELELMSVCLERPAATWEIC